MKPTNNVYIGDRELDPPDEDEPVTEVCHRCGGWGWIDGDEDFSGDCPDCGGAGHVELTDSEIQQRKFDDYDPPDSDFGEPL